MPINCIALRRAMRGLHPLGRRILPWARIAPMGLALLWGWGAQAAGPVDPSGTWLIADGRARIRVEPCLTQAKLICGYVVWLKTPLSDEGKPRLDTKNPDLKKRGRAILGHQMMLGLKPNDDDHYEGKVYNSEEGKFVDVTAWKEEADELKVHGCMLAILCGSQTWSLVKDMAPGQITGAVNAPGGPRSDPEWTPKPEHDKPKP